MSVTAAIRRMIDAGLSVEQALTAAECFEAEMPTRSKAAERQARYRERNKASQTVTRDACDEKSAPLDPPPNVPGPLNTPPYNPPQKQEKGSARGRRLPEDWQPTEKHFVLGKSLGFSDQAIREAADAMRDWADSNRHRAVGRKADWDKTFNNWLRNNVPKSHSARDGPRKNNVIDAADALNTRIRERYNAKPDAKRYQQALPSPDRW